MALTGSDSLAVFAKREALLVILFDDLLKHILRKRHAGTIGRCDQFNHVGPTVVIHRKADRLWLMAKNKTQELAESDELMVHLINHPRFRELFHDQTCEHNQEKKDNTAYQTSLSLCLFARSVKPLKPIYKKPNDTRYEEGKWNDNRGQEWPKTYDKDSLLRYYSGNYK